MKLTVLISAITGNIRMSMQVDWGTGIRGLTTGTPPQGNQELLMVKDKVGRPQVSFG